MSTLPWVAVKFAASRLASWPAGGRMLRWGLLSLSCVFLSGCFPLLDGSSDDDKNPLIAEARAKKATYNYQGAIDSLEKALEANPRSALAHWELGLIYYQNQPDYAFAIYHFKKLLKLRPDFKQADTVKEFINVCIIELAKTAPLAPQTPQVQREIDKLTARQVELAHDNAQLNEKAQALQILAQQLTLENNQLKAQLRAATAAPPPPADSVAAQPAPPRTNARTAPLLSSNVTVFRAPSNVPGPSPPNLTGPAPVIRSNVLAVVRPVPSVTRPAPAVPTPIVQAQIVPPAKPRLHVVKSGETAYAIARLYRIKVAELLDANPGLDATRLKPGQQLRLPSS